MRPLLILSGLLLSLSCFSQTLSREEQTKVDNALNAIKSVTELGDTCDAKKSESLLRFRITPNYVDSSKLPLLIIDGVLYNYMALQLLDPNTIETIQVLKTEKSTSFICGRPPRDTIIVTRKRNVPSVIN
jgi:hypothetical protein